MWAGGQLLRSNLTSIQKKVIFIQFANEIEYIHPERVVVGSTLFREAFKYFFADFFSEKGWVLFKSPKLIPEKNFPQGCGGTPNFHSKILVFCAVLSPNWPFFNLI